MNITRIAATPLLSVSLALATSLSAAAQQTPAPGTTTVRAPATESPGKAETAVEKIRAYSISQREQAMAQAKRAMDEIDTRIAKLDADMRARGARMDAAARKHADVAMADLRARRVKLEDWASRMRAAAPPAWEEVKSGFIASYHELADAFRRARAQFDGTQPPSREP